MGENNDKAEREFWTKYSLKISNDLLRKMQTIHSVLSKDALSASQKIYVELSGLESKIDGLYDMLK